MTPIRFDSIRTPTTSHFASCAYECVLVVLMIEKVYSDDRNRSNWEQEVWCSVRYDGAYTSTAGSGGGEAARLLLVRNLFQDCSKSVGTGSRCAAGVQHALDSGAKVRYSIVPYTGSYRVQYRSKVPFESSVRVK